MRVCRALVSGGWRSCQPALQSPPAPPRPPRGSALGKGRLREVGGEGRERTRRWGHPARLAGSCVCRRRSWGPREVPWPALPAKLRAQPPTVPKKGSSLPNPSVGQAGPHQLSATSRQSLRGPREKRGHVERQV